MLSPSLGTPEAASNADGTLSAHVPGFADMLAGLAAGGASGCT